MARHVKRLGSALGQTIKPVQVTDSQAADGLSDFVSGMQTMALKNEKVGIGTPRDQRAYSDYSPTTPLNRVVLESLYVGSWLGNRIVSTLPEDMLRNWRTVKWEGMAADNDANVKTVERLEKKLKVKKRLLTASKWARLYGGCLMIPILRSQPDEVLSEPLDYDQIQKDDLVGFHVIDRWRCNHDGSIVYDAMDPACGMPQHYRLAESAVTLHHTRVIRLNGREVPYFLWRANSMWDHSVLQILINNLKQYDTAVAAITTMMFQMNVDIVLQSGLRATLSTKNGEAKAIERFRQFALNKSFNGVGVLDKDTEEYQRHPYTFSGVDKAFDKVMYDVAGAADVPFTKLFGQSPAGMNATGESDDRHYETHLEARREDHLDDPLNELDQFLVRSALGYMPDGYESEWNDVHQSTDAEKADIDNKRAQTSKLHFDMGAIDEGVVANDIYTRGSYKGMTQQHVKNAQTVARLSHSNTKEILTNPASAVPPALLGKGEQKQAPTGKSDDASEDDDESK